jgi:hypothetical protein
MQTRRHQLLVLGLTMALAVVASVTAHASAPPCEEICTGSSSCSEPCDWTTCGEWGVCAQPCDTVCGSGTHCSTACDNGGAVMSCYEYGSCDPATFTCYPRWVEIGRSSMFRFYVKSWVIYHELWADQYIYQQDMDCGQGTRTICDTLLRGRCYNTSASDCCTGFGHICHPSNETSCQ